MKKTSFYLLIMLFALCAASCKQDEYLDWKTLNQQWLEQNKAANANNPNFHTTSSGLQYIVEYQGYEGDRKPNKTGYVTVTYTGTLIDGHQFDSGSNVSLTLSSVIAGWTEGLCKMNKHGDYILYIPYELAYGTEGSGTAGYDNYIPPYSTLIFKIHLSDCYL